MVRSTMPAGAADVVDVPGGTVLSAGPADDGGGERASRHGDGGLGVDLAVGEDEADWAPAAAPEAPNRCPT